MDVLHAGLKLEKEIFSGVHGASGSRFMSVRELAQYCGCSYVTAVKTASWLRSRCMIRMEGSRQYVTAGRTGKDSELESLLAQRRRPCVGMLLPAADNSFYAAIFSHMKRQLESKGLELFAAIHGSDEKTERTQLEMMVDMGMSGVLFFSHKDFNNHRAFENCPIPVVCLGRDIRGFSRSVVSVNNYDVGRRAAQHLIGKGYTHFAYVGMSQTHFMKDMRLKGFASTLKAQGYALEQENIVVLSADQGENEERIGAFLSGLPGPVGVFCYHDLLAVSSLKACRAIGKRIPQDISVVGCDDLPIASTTVPSLTTVHYPYAQIALQAADILENELHTGESCHESIVVKPRIIERDSTRLLP